MGVEFDTSYPSKDLVTAWLETGGQGHNLYGSTCYAKKSWISELVVQNRRREGQHLAEHGSDSVTSDDNGSQVDSSSNENTWTSTQSSQSTDASSATDLTDYSESEDEKTHCPTNSIQQLSNQPCLNSRGNYVELLHRVPTNPKDDSLQQGLPSTTSDSSNGDHTSSTTSNYVSSGHCRRRTGLQHRTQQPPCKLKRDTESTDHFVTLLIIFATRLVTAIWPLSASPPMMSSCFNGAGVLPLRVFIQETLRRSKTSYSTLQVALYYLILLKDKLPHCDSTQDRCRSSASSSSSSSCSEEMSPRSTCRAMQCGRRMFLSALMLASKYLQDRNYSTRAWSKISGLRSNEINENEREYLRMIDYQLHLPKTAFDNWSKIVLALSKLSKCSPQDEVSVNGHNFRTSSFNLEHLLSDFSSDTSSDDASHLRFSESWWSDLLRSLDSDLVRDMEQTDQFLQCHILPASEANQGLHGSNLPTPPTSPDYSSDAYFNVLRAQGADASVVTTSLSQPSSRAQSPMPLNSIPSQPRLPNLPTPVSTPGPLRFCNVAKESFVSAHARSPASVAALRTIQRQPAINANLDRCPPPRPHAFAASSTHFPFRPAASDMENLGQSDRASCTGPVMVTSTTWPATRSRSSSMTSNSPSHSWQAGTNTAPTNVLREPQSSVPHHTAASVGARSTTSPDQHNQYPYSQPSLRHDVPSLNMPLNEGACAEQDALLKLIEKETDLDSTLGAAESLMALAFRGKHTSSGEVTQNKLQPEYVRFCPRKAHKRTRSRVDNDKMQDHVRQLLAANSPPTSPVEDACSTASEMPMNRRIQTPTKCWAGSKLPVLNKQCSKRVALQCPASEMAAKFLKPKFFKGILSAN